MDHFQKTHVPASKLLAAGTPPRLLTSKKVSANLKNTAPIIYKAKNPAAEQTGLPKSARSGTGSGLAIGEKAAAAAAADAKKPGGQPVRLGNCAQCRQHSALRSPDDEICSHCRIILQINEVIERGDIVPEVWQKIKQSLCLPKRLAKLSLKEAEGLHRMLGGFIKRVSAEEQKDLHDGRLVGLLLDLPEMPKIYRQILNTTVRNLSANHTAPTNRQNVSVSEFTAVALRQGTVCYWCGIRVVREAAVPAPNRIERNQTTIKYLDADGRIREDAYGTIDHLVRVADGGNNDPVNLVISCTGCNLEREDRRQ